MLRELGRMSMRQNRQEYLMWRIGGRLPPVLYVCPLFRPVTAFGEDNEDLRIGAEDLMFLTGHDLPRHTYLDPAIDTHSDDEPEA